jgi:hypothetical protein
MTSRSKQNQQGVALIFCLLALMILTAVTASLILMSGTETSVNGNYRTEEIAYFAAKSGVYEALDRMQQSNSSTIAAQIPTVAPSATGGVLYIINAASGQTVQPWNTSNTYYDDELCHEGYSITGMSSAPPDVPCTTLPTGSTWYTTVNSNYPWSGTSAAMPYEWVRINWKQNTSQSYISGGTTPTVSNYSVNSTGSSANPVCYNGGSEVLLSTPTGVSPAYTSCEQYQTCAAASPVIGTPVLLITALSVTSNGSRQMVQAEAALNPPSVTVPQCGISDAYGFFAYGGTCTSPGLTIGGNASVDGYNSKLGTYAATKSNALGDVGTNGGAVAQGTSTSIGGNVYVPNVGTGTPPGPGSCPGDDFSVSGSPHYGALVQSTVLPMPIVTIPSNSAATTVSSGTIVPGNYGTLSVGSHGTVTLTAPGTYNFDCINVGSWGTVTTSPATGKVTINVSGSGCASSPITFNSHATLNNASGVASNVQINVPQIGAPGSAAITVTGGPQMYCVLNAPYAAVSVNGGADYYGTIMAYTIDDHGGTNLHFDAADTSISGAAASTATATATGSYNVLAFHALSY